MVRGGANCFVSTGVVMVIGFLEGRRGRKDEGWLKCRMGNINHSMGKQGWV